jgi:hypothetical protein
VPYDDLADHVGAVRGASVRLRRSAVAGDSPASNELMAGEVAANTADGCLYVGTTGGAAGTIPGAVGFNQIVTLTQSAYDAITATVSATTLYIVTPDPS